MRFRIIAPLVAVALAAGGAAAQAARPQLPRNADPNDWEAYYDHGTSILRNTPSEADHYLEWAARLAPNRAEPLYARWVALHLQDVNRFEEYMRGESRVLRRPEIIRSDSMLLRAQVRNPFMHRGLIVLLYDAMPGYWGQDLYTRGMLNYASGRLDEAVRMMSEYVQRSPRSLDARWQLALALVSSGKMDSAQVVMDTLVARMRQRDETRVVRVYDSKEMQEYASGLLALARRQPAQAREYMERALVEDASAWFAHAGRAMALQAEGRAPEAVQEMAAAMELAPADAMLRYNYGSALLDAAQPDEAAEQLRQAVKMEPYWADAWGMLGDAERRAGHNAEAVAAYEKFISLAPRRSATSIQAARTAVAALRQPATP